MLKFYQRFGFSGAIILLCCLLVLIGCSSSKPVPEQDPYYLPTLPDSYKNDVKIDPATIRYRIILLGDGGEPMDEEPVLTTLGKWAKQLPEKTSIVFLGDNIYPAGLRKDKWKEDIKRLNPQLDVVIENQARGLFIPGNHDWENGRETGLETIIRQADFINQKLDAQVEEQHPAFLPEKGNPGPSVLEFPIAAPVVRLVVLDTQWWFHRHPKKSEKERKDVIADLKTKLKTELPVVVVGHHPIETYGPHGGGGKLNKLGFVCDVLRVFNGNACSQSVKDTLYASMIHQLNEVFLGPDRTSLLIYAAGHDHSLQVLKGCTADYLLVSGAAACQKLSDVKYGDNTLLAYKHTGFMVVDFLEGGKVLLRVVKVFVGTIPHVTIAPITQGLGKKDGEYFENYGPFFATEKSFRKEFGRTLNRCEVQCIDKRIDAFNDIIIAEAKKNWHIVDICKLLDSLAIRRNANLTEKDDGAKAREVLETFFSERGASCHPLLCSHLKPTPSVLRLDSCKGKKKNSSCRTAGGFFSLDCFHPTTIGYGLIAEAFLEKMKEAKVPEIHKNGRLSWQQLDWRTLIQQDTLVNDPPALWDDIIDAAIAHPHLADIIYRILL